jgi:hypothetical protein
MEGLQLSDSHEELGKVATEDVCVKKIVSTSLPE